MGTDGNFSDNFSGNTDNSDNSTNASGNSSTDGNFSDNFSGNTDNSDNSDNSDNCDKSDNSANDSFNDEDSYNDYEDSYNKDSYNDTDIDIDNSTNLDDDSVTVGVRQYNTGFGDLHVGGLAGAGAAAAAAGSLHLEIDNRATQVDQSVNQAISAGGNVTQGFANGAVVNTGDWGAAAGDDASVSNTETTISTGDIL